MSGERFTEGELFAATLGLTGKLSEKDSDECRADEADAIEYVAMLRAKLRIKEEE